MTYYVLRQVHPRGLDAIAKSHDDVITLALAAAAGEMVHGDYLEWSDPDAKNGYGDDRWTTDLNRAQRFGSFSEAMECWKAQSRVRPLRDDGKPNRPMTAYHVTPERVEE